MQRIIALLSLIFAQAMSAQAVEIQGLDITPPPAVLDEYEETLGTVASGTPVSYFTSEQGIILPAGVVSDKGSIVLTTLVDGKEYLLKRRPEASEWIRVLAPKIDSNRIASACSSSPGFSDATDRYYSTSCGKVFDMHNHVSIGRRGFDLPSRDDLEMRTAGTSGFSASEFVPLQGIFLDSEGREYLIYSVPEEVTPSPEESAPGGIYRTNLTPVRKSYTTIVGPPPEDPQEFRPAGPVEIAGAGDALTLAYSSALPATPPPKNIQTHAGGFYPKTFKKLLFFY